MREDGKVDYVEMPGGELPATKAFYAQAFGWGFTDYGPDYAAFNEGLDGGFHTGQEDDEHEHTYDEGECVVCHAPEPEDCRRLKPRRSLPPPTGECPWDPGRRRTQKNLLGCSQPEQTTSVHRNCFR